MNDADVRRAEATAIALEKSRAHWWRMADGVAEPGEYIGAKDCALCVLHSDSCAECPISIYTGQAYCDGSPYDNACRMERCHGMHSRDFRSAAWDMALWLDALAGGWLP